MGGEVPSEAREEHIRGGEEWAGEGAGRAEGLVSAANGLPERRL